MKQAKFLVTAALLAVPAYPATAQWTPQTLSQLHRAVEAAPQDALPRPDDRALRAAEAKADPVAIGQAAQALALALARAHLLGAAGPAERRGWGIEDPDAAIDLEAALGSALSSGNLDSWFESLRPQHPDYAGLRAAYAMEKDPARRAAEAKNMERWRWMPRSLGSDYVLVNAASFEARLWRKGRQAGAWRVIVGKPKTPTPTFQATITGVNFNPWWNVPSSIVRESVGGLIRRNPSLARQRGYVWSGGQVRQKPGPGNALGQMKLVMPNPYSVYMHDTPNRDLFAQDVRAFSHGCMRVGDALGFAQTLLEGVKTRDEIDAIVAGGESQVVNLVAPIRVYVTYFTAGMRGDGTFGVFADIYGRDARLKVAARSSTECSA